MGATATSSSIRRLAATAGPREAAASSAATTSARVYGIQVKPTRWRLCVDLFSLGTGVSGRGEDVGENANQPYFGKLFHGVGICYPLAKDKIPAIPIYLNGS